MEETTKVTKPAKEENGTKDPSTPTKKIEVSWFQVWPWALLTLFILALVTFWVITRPTPPLKEKTLAGLELSKKHFWPVFYKDEIETKKGNPSSQGGALIEKLTKGRSWGASGPIEYKPNLVLTDGNNSLNIKPGVLVLRIGTKQYISPINNDEYQKIESDVTSLP